MSAEEQLRNFTVNGGTIDIGKYQNSMFLGSALKANTTLFIQYRIGGGISSNLGVNVITQIKTVNFAVIDHHKEQIVLLFPPLGVLMLRLL